MNTIKDVSNTLNQYSVLILAGIIILLIVITTSMYRKKEFLSSGHRPHHRLLENMVGVRSSPDYAYSYDPHLLKQNSDYFYADWKNPIDVDAEHFTAGSNNYSNHGLPVVYGTPSSFTLESLISGGSKLRNKSERSDASWDVSNVYGGHGGSGWRRKQENYEYTSGDYASGGAHGNYLPTTEQHLYKATLGL